MAQNIVIDEIECIFSHEYILLYVAQQPLVGQDFLFIEGARSHSDTPHSVGLLWMIDQPDATQNTDKRQASIPPTGIQTRNPSKRAVADPCLRPHGH